MYINEMGRAQSDTYSSLFTKIGNANIQRKYTNEVIGLPHSLFISHTISSQLSREFVKTRKKVL